MFLSHGMHECNGGRRNVSSALLFSNKIMRMEPSVYCYPWNTTQCYFDGLMKKDATSLLTHWSYVFLAVNHQHMPISAQVSGKLAIMHIGCSRIISNNFNPLVGALNQNELFICLISVVSKINAFGRIRQDKNYVYLLWHIYTLDIRHLIGLIHVHSIIYVYRNLLVHFQWLKFILR